MTQISVREVSCPECFGDGCIITDVPGGRFNAAMEQWYPDEKTETCERCFGTGYVEVDEEIDEEDDYE
jgi:RecJ-like exonuclease